MSRKVWDLTANTEVVKLSSAKSALAFAARGWPVFPCSPNDKQPLVAAAVKGEGGVKLASLDARQILQWWREWPLAMIGMRMGRAGCGLFAVDLDAKFDGPSAGKLEDLRVTLARLKRDLTAAPDVAGAGVASSFGAEVSVEAGYALPPCPMIRTPRGGLHLYFRVPAGELHVGNRTGVIPGIDIRGEGGYVILPPSVRNGPKAKAEQCDGIAYAWVEDSGIDDFEPPEAPPELIKFATEKIAAAGKGQGAPAKRKARAAALGRSGMTPAREKAIKSYVFNALEAEIRKVENAT